MNPVLNAEELIAMASGESFDADDARGWLHDALDEKFIDPLIDAQGRQPSHLLR